eukprot:scaffold30170_cov199-Amphora_coffeaeformis.AAC.1
MIPPPANLITSLPPTSLPQISNLITSNLKSQTSLPQISNLKPHYLKPQTSLPHFLITANLIIANLITANLITANLITANLKPQTSNLKPQTSNLKSQTSLPHYLITSNLKPQTSLPPYPIAANSIASFKHDTYTHYVSSLPPTAHCSRKSLPPYRKKTRHIRSPVPDPLRPE